MGYRPELDGIRGVAILMVMFFHGVFVLPQFKLLGGFVGVDMFFVLSGFLITTLLVQEFDRSGNVSFRRFFHKRALRLLPALALSLLVAAAVVAYQGGNLGVFLQQAVATVTYTANWFEGAGQSLGVLTPMWSLAVEGQFYLLWPPILVLALRRRVDRGRLVMLLLGAVVAVAAARGALFRVDIAKALYWTITRSDGLLVGSALALALPNQRLRRVFSSTPAVLGSVAMAVVIVWRISPVHSSVYNGLLLVLNVCFAMIIGHLAVRETGAVARIARAKPLVRIGVISYGLYVFHLPLFSLVGTWMGDRKGWGVFLPGAAAAFLLAAASYFVVERPALRLKPRAVRKQVPAERIAV